MSDTPRTPQDFAEERSHRNAVVSNETGRAAAQAAILINGGAATAVLTYLAKGTVEAALLIQAAACMLGYMSGVALGASMLYAMTKSLDFYSVRWRDAAYPSGSFTDSPSDPNARTKAFEWALISQRFFWAAIIVFVLSSLGTALTLANYRFP